MATGTYGFPSAIADDPVLDLAMPAPERFPYAEKRRLLHVALTRARRAVVLITPANQMSPFVVELLDDPGVTVIGGEGDAATEACPGCGRGVMVERAGPFGPFLACSTFPACEHSRNLPARAR